MVLIISLLNLDGALDGYISFTLNIRSSLSLMIVLPFLSFFLSSLSKIMLESLKREESKGRKRKKSRVNEIGGKWLPSPYLNVSKIK